MISILFLILTRIFFKYYDMFFFSFFPAVWLKIRLKKSVKHIFKFMKGLNHIIKIIQYVQPN